MYGDLREPCSSLWKLAAASQKTVFAVSSTLLASRLGKCYSCEVKDSLQTETSLAT